MEDEKKLKPKKGWLAVRVGLDGDAAGFRRFSIPISYLYHPLFERLLDAARDAYGYRATGPLTLPCSADEFLRLLCLIDSEPGRRRHQLCQLNHHHSFSLHSC